VSAYLYDVGEQVPSRRDLFQFLPATRHSRAGLFYVAPPGLGSEGSFCILPKLTYLLELPTGCYGFGHSF
jgi:hypothetical protein